MKSKAYDDWVSLYNDDLIEVWHQERDELKTSSMILYVLKRELTRIRKEAEQDVAKTRKCLQQRDDLNTSMPPCISCRESKSNKENFETLWNPAFLGVKPLDDIGEDIQSPEIFRIASPKSKGLNMGGILNENETSPTIKKRIKRPRCKFNQNLSPSLLLGANAKENKVTAAANNLVNMELRTHQNAIKNIEVSPAPNNLLNMELRTPENYITLQKDKTNLDHALIDSTIIDSTPCAPSTKKSKSFGRGRSIGKQSLLSMKKPSKRVKCIGNDTTFLPTQTNTLTQMMSRDFHKGSSSKPNEESVILESSDEDLPNSMNISDILAYVDEHQMNPSTPNKSTTCRIQTDTKTNKSSLKHDVKPLQIKLSGWSCQDCEVFYGNLNLAPEDLEKKMDDCFKRHRKVEMHQETYAGFWDVGMPNTPESQLTKEQSTIFHP